MGAEQQLCPTSLNFSITPSGPSVHSPTGAAWHRSPNDPGSRWRVHARALFPMAGHPHPMVCGMHPIAFDPGVGGIRRRPFHFGPRHRRMLGHHDRTSCARRRHRFFRNDHRLMMRDASTEENARHHWQNTQRYSFHNFSPGPQFDEPGPPPPPRNDLNIRAPRQTTGRSSATLWEGNLPHRRGGFRATDAVRAALRFLRQRLPISGRRAGSIRWFHP